jgi:hypothetical protein
MAITPQGAPTTVHGKPNAFCTILKDVFMNKLNYLVAGC